MINYCFLFMNIFSGSQSFNKMHHVANYVKIFAPLISNFISVLDYINPFIFIRNKRPVISSEGFFALEKNAVVCPQRAVLPIQPGTTTRAD
jgi:hypothetical protein